MGERAARCRAAKSGADARGGPRRRADRSEMAATAEPIQARRAGIDHAMTWVPREEGVVRPTEPDAALSAAPTRVIRTTNPVQAASTSCGVGMPSARVQTARSAST